MIELILLILLLVDIIYIIKNHLLIKKYNLKEIYEKEKNKIKNEKFYKIFKIITYILLILFIIYLPFGITEFMFSIVFIIIDNGDKLSETFDIGVILMYCLFTSLIINKLRMRYLINKKLNKKNI